MVMNGQRHQCDAAGTAAVGVALILIGCFLLTGYLGFWHEIARYWPVSLIAVGVWQLIGRTGAREDGNGTARG